MGADTVVLAGNRNQPCIAEAHPSSARTATISIHRRPDFPIFVATVLAAVLFTAGAKASAVDCAVQPCPSETERQATGEPGTNSVDRRAMTARDLYRACLAEQGWASGWCAAYQHMLDDEPRLVLMHFRANDAARLSEDRCASLAQMEVARC